MSYQTTKSAAAYEAAERVIAGGVNSGARGPDAGWIPSPPVVARGQGAELWGALDAAAVEVIGRPFEPVGLNAWADSGLTQGAGIPTVMIGGAGGNFHAPDEWTSIPELASVATIVADAAVRYCGIED